MLINANALSIPLAAKSVHTVVTSPPYYGLRDYGTAKWVSIHASAREATHYSGWFAYTMLNKFHTFL